MNEAKKHQNAVCYGTALAVVFAALPLIWVASLVVFVLKWLSFHGGLPDTSTLRSSIAISLAPYETICGMLLMFNLFTFPLWLAVLVYLHVFILPRRNGLWWILLFGPWLLVLILWIWDPGGYFNWLID